MTQSQDDAAARASRLIAGAISELVAANPVSTAQAEEIARHRATIEGLEQDLRRHIAEEREQRSLLAAQMTNLAGSLDRLVTHLESISLLMSDLVERLATPAPVVTAPSPPAMTGEPMFQPGGEGISLSIVSVPGFQALMDIQKALMAQAQVSNASVERFQEGESRILLTLREPVAAAHLAAALGEATGHVLTVEEARPELMRLRLKIVG